MCQDLPVSTDVHHIQPLVLAFTTLEPLQDPRATKLWHKHSESHIISAAPTVFKLHSERPYLARVAGMAALTTATALSVARVVTRRSVFSPSTTVWCGCSAPYRAVRSTSCEGMGAPMGACHTGQWTSEVEICRSLIIWCACFLAFIMPFVMWLDVFTTQIHVPLGMIAGQACYHAFYHAMNQ